MARIDQDMWISTVRNYFPNTSIANALDSFDYFTREPNRDFLAFAKALTDNSVTDSIDKATYMWGYVNRLADLKVEQKQTSKAKADLDALRAKLVTPDTFSKEWWDKYLSEVSGAGLSRVARIKEMRAIVQRDTGVMPSLSESLSAYNRKFEW